MSEFRFDPPFYLLPVAEALRERGIAATTEHTGGNVYCVSWHVGDAIAYAADNDEIGWGAELVASDGDILGVVYDVAPTGSDPATVAAALAAIDWSKAER